VRNSAKMLDFESIDVTSAMNTIECEPTVL